MSIQRRDILIFPRKEQVIDIDAQPSFVSETDAMPEFCFAGQSAIHIDHILESILSNLEMNDLTQTRLLSRRFNYFSCKTIESILKFYLEDIGCLNSPPSADTFVAPHDGKREISRTLFRDFGNSQLRFGLPFKSRGTLEKFISTLSTANRFPCGSYSLGIANILEPRLQNFFTFQGIYIRKLFLKIIATISSQITKLTFLPSQLAHLLSNILPNLQNLILNVSSNLSYQERGGLPVLPYKEFILPNLKSLTIIEATRPIVDMLINAAVNLQEYNPPDHFYLNYFTKNPGNTRLNLLKHLHLIPCHLNLNDLESIAELLATKIEFQVRILNLEIILIEVSPELWPRVSLIINKIFHNVSGTVKEIFMDPIQFLPGIQSLVFPKVHKLMLQRCSPAFYPLSIEGYFPVGDVNICRMFPILKFIAVNKYVFKTDAVYFNSDINSSAWKPIDETYKDFNWWQFNDDSQWQYYQVFARRSY